MALNVERVKEKFARYSGEDPLDAGDRGTLCAELCAECASRGEALAAGLETPPTPEQAELLESWAAAEAFYQLVLADEAVAPESVSADGVKLTLGERAEKARALAGEKRKALSPVLGEEVFWFGSI